MQCILCKIYFWKVFHKYYNFICAPICTKVLLLQKVGVTKRHKGRSAGPTPWSGGHTLSRFKMRLDGYAPKSVYKSIPCSKVSGDQKEWPVSHVDGCPTIHQLQTDSIKLVEAPLDLYIKSSRVFARAPEVVLEIGELLYPYLSL
jgi:hypothetical protein